MTPSKQRNDIVAKRVALIFGALCLILLTVLITLFGPNVNSPIIFALALFFFGIGYFIDLGYSITGRLLLSIVPPTVTFLAALLAKINGTNYTDILYYDSRFILILLSILPCLIFDREEKWPLYASICYFLAILVAFDPVHEIFKVGYFQKGFTGRSYYYINAVVVVTFLGIVAAALTMKWIVQISEQRYNLTVQRLEVAFKNLESQNRQILDQQQELMGANALIEMQKVALQQQVKDVNSSLQDANEALVKHNNELRQFSYTISHNLRGPIARLLGLSDLARRTSIHDDEDTVAILNHIQRSAKDLDGVIKDLNHVVDLRNDVFNVKETVHWNEEWEKTKTLLQISDDFLAKHFVVDFTAAPIVKSVRSMISSILYNLVSNAIKYQAPEKVLRIEIETTVEENFVVLKVRDNGLGIDLQLFGADVFRLYKRFHTHQEGKGIGLYLVKSQVEMLNGVIELDSNPGLGSTFRVKFPLAST